MTKQKQIQKKILSALFLLTSEENLSLKFVILLMLMSLVRTRLNFFCFIRLELNFPCV